MACPLSPNITPVINYVPGGFTTSVAGLGSSGPFALVNPGGAAFTGTIVIDGPSGSITGKGFNCGDSFPVKVIYQTGCSFAFTVNMPDCPTSTCPTTDLTANNTIVYNSTGFTVTFPLSANVLAQAGNTYNMVVTRGDGSTVPSSAVVTGVHCGTYGTVSVLVAEGANQCIETFDYKMPMCPTQPVACPSSFTIDKLICTTFEVSWKFGAGTVPDTMQVEVYDEVTGTILYVNTAWNTMNRILNSADLGIVLSPLQSIAVKLASGNTPDLILFNDFYIPECVTYDCPECDCEPIGCYKKVDWVLFFILIIMIIIMMLFWFLILPKLLMR